MIAIGIDIGGTSIKGAAVNDKGQVPSYHGPGPEGLPMKMTDQLIVNLKDVSTSYSSGETSMSVSSDILIHRVRNGSDTIIRRVKASDTKIDNLYKIDLSGLMGGDEIYLSTDSAKSHTGTYWYWYHTDSEGGGGYYNKYTHTVSCAASTCSGFSVACEVANYASAGAVW